MSSEHKRGAAAPVAAVQDPERHRVSKTWEIDIGASICLSNQQAPVPSPAAFAISS